MSWIPYGPNIKLHDWCKVHWIFFASIICNFTGSLNAPKKKHVLPFSLNVSCLDQNSRQQTFKIKLWNKALRYFEAVFDRRVFEGQLLACKKTCFVTNLFFCMQKNLFWHNIFFRFCCCMWGLVLHVLGSYRNLFLYSCTQRNQLFIVVQSTEIRLF